MNTETFSLPVRNNITLRFIRLDEAEALYKLVDKNRVYLRGWLNWVDDQSGPEVSKGNVLTRVQKAKEGTELELGVYLDSILIGSMGFNKLSKHNKSGEIGYWISEEFQRKGIMIDCVKTLIKYGFQELKLQRIEIGCSEKNARSRAIPERLGFTFEGVAREAYFLYDHFEDSRKYGLLEQEWRNETYRAANTTQNIPKHSTPARTQPDKVILAGTGSFQSGGQKTKQSTDGQKHKKIC